ncbi:hypothetical protein BGAL_0370g00040 [Botrytis galanthina]|uniref:Uncharacterized protein n=1 Tax=Botrytis galanthina TaxID=278940 RepID=A0A4S8QR21_9HELO|nr:hypothetical protein BGAL_0370g00040 [Botrytis galanthina]
MAVNWKTPKLTLLTRFRTTSSSSSTFSFSSSKDNESTLDDEAQALRKERTGHTSILEILTQVKTGCKKKSNLEKLERVIIFCRVTFLGLGLESGFGVGFGFGFGHENLTWCNGKARDG